MILGFSVILNYICIGIILYFALAIRKGLKRKLDMDKDFNLEDMLLNILFYPLYLKRYIDIFLTVRSVKKSTGLNSSRYVMPGVQHYKMNLTTMNADPPHIREGQNRLGNIFDRPNQLKGNTFKKQTSIENSSNRVKKNHGRAGTIYSISYNVNCENVLNPEKIRLKYAA
jgi:hypothetical protein